jgi:hypothetical protein
MAALLPLVHRAPPRLYRVARLLRRLSVVVLVAALVFLGTAAYSAVRLIQASHQSEGYSAAFASNGTVAVTGSVSLSNPGYYPLTGFELNLRLLNSSGVYLGVLRAGPVDVAPGGSTSFPFSLYLPITSGSAAESLLVADQYLSVGVWGNATYAYLFPVSVHFSQSKSWGAPFALLRVTAGVRTTVNGSMAEPVTISFSNDASFADVGSLGIELYQANGLACGGTTFAMNVAAGTSYEQTQDLALASGCSVAGGYVIPTFSGPSGTVVLPREALP